LLFVSGADHERSDAGLGDQPGEGDLNRPGESGDFLA
jgi:hypothetical protein